MRSFSLWTVASKEATARLTHNKEIANQKYVNTQIPSTLAYSKMDAPGRENLNAEIIQIVNKTKPAANLVTSVDFIEVIPVTDTSGSRPEWLGAAGTGYYALSS